MRLALRLAKTSLALALAEAACSGPQADPSDFTGSALTTQALQLSATNAHADDPSAAALGRRLFFDTGFSADGTVACVGCHDPTQGFSDARARSVGVRGQLGDRHSMPVTTAVVHPFLFWDGRADSAWSQPLKALENPKEMDFTRVEVASRVNATYRTDYEAVFGPLPDLAALPARAKPGDAAWSQMAPELRTDVERVFSNFGKAIEAYERKLLCQGTRFDQWVSGAATLSASEQAGEVAFRNDHCTRCHSGPSFSDGLFHDIGIPSTDEGRALGAPLLLADRFNGAGAYSDDVTAGTAKLSLIPKEAAQEGAFRTASLRGVGQRTFFGHASHQQTLRGFILDIYRRGGGRGNGGRVATVGAIDPLLDDVNVDTDDVEDLVAFLHTLDCPTPSTELLAP